ncbi:MAG: pseudouridylate synthase [Bacteroides sp.]|nr:pseudouridylate synthase [Bacteroides sp.]MCM1084880.1 pseudouridylate synthase [Bacteroides sp.]
METKVKYEEVPIESIIPQRRPFIMVDKLLDVSENSADTELLIGRDNIFVENGCFVESGMIEHMAQTCAAGMGYVAIHSLQDRVRIGFLSAIRGLRINRCPKVGEVLHTHISIEEQFMGVVLVGAISSVGNEVVAEGKMKIFITETDENNP